MIYKDLKTLRIINFNTFKITTRYDHFSCIIFRIIYEILYKFLNEITNF